MLKWNPCLWIRKETVKNHIVIAIPIDICKSEARMIVNGNVFPRFIVFSLDAACFGDFSKKLRFRRDQFWISQFPCCGPSGASGGSSGQPVNVKKENKTQKDHFICINYLTEVASRVKFFKTIE